MRVAVLAGGRSSEHEVSLASAEAVRAGLVAGGHEPLDVRLDRDGGWSRDGDPLLLEPGGGLLGCEVAFPVLHGPFGEDGTVQGLLEILDVPYVGAGVTASALAMDKALFKDLMAAHGMPQVDYTVVRQGERPSLGAPVFVKPARLGSSVGIAKAWSEADVDGALEGAFRHDPVALVERFSEGIEVECSVLGHSDPVASQPGEIVIRRRRLVRLRGQVLGRGHGAARPAEGAGGRERGGATRWPWRCSGWWAARAWPASTSSWRTTSCWSTS